MTMKTTTKKQASEQNENVIDFGMEQPFNICKHIMDKVDDIMNEKDLPEVEIYFHDRLLNVFMTLAEDRTKFLSYISTMLLSYLLDYKQNSFISSVVVWYDDEKQKFGLSASQYL